MNYQTHSQQARSAFYHPSMHPLQPRVQHVLPHPPGQFSVTDEYSLTSKPLDMDIRTKRWETLQDVLVSMRRQEAKYYQNQSTSSLHGRPPMVQWMFSVIDIFDLAPQIVPTALFFLDKCPAQDVTQFQIMGMVCLELAIKVHDTKIFPLEELCRMNHQQKVTPQQISEWEAKLLAHLKWDLHPPTPHCFIHQYGELLEILTGSDCSRLVQRSLQLVRRALYGSAAIPPAIVGYAAILAAMEDFPPCGQYHIEFVKKIHELTGLSATSPGLAQAYQSICNKTPRHGNSSPRNGVATPRSASRASSPVYCQPLQHQLVSTYQPHSRPTSPVSCASSTSQMAPATTYSVHSPPVTTAASSCSQYIGSRQRLEMIYSAGEELGFEVTLNPAGSEEYLGFDLEDEFLDLSMDDKPQFCGRFRSGLSPRNVTGAVSPDRG